jgi:hypothetical protein
LAAENKRKKMRRKPYIRYERDHSLSAVHLDWHTSKINGKEVCVVLNDSSRFILAGGEFDGATGETSIELVRKVLEDYGKFGKSERSSQIMDHNFLQTRPTKKVILRAISMLFLLKII